MAASTHSKPLYVAELGAFIPFVFRPQTRSSLAAGKPKREERKLILARRSFSAAHVSLRFRILVSIFYLIMITFNALSRR